MTSLSLSRITLSALALLLAATANPAQSAAAQQQTSQKMQMRMAMPTIAPLFLENQEFSSTLYLVNELNIPASARVSLFDLEGNMIGMETVSFEPNSQQKIAVRGLLEKFKSTASFGSLRMEPQTSSGVGILAQLSLTHYGAKTTFFDEEMLMPSTEGSSTVRAVSDGERFSVVAITSLSQSAQEVTVSCIQDARSPVAKNIPLPANQTVIVRPCSTEGTPFIGTVSSDFGEEDSKNAMPGKSAGISIVSNSMPGSFAAYGFTYHGNRAEDYFSSINFSDPKMLRSSGLAYAGIPVGYSSLLPSGTFTPRISVANFSSTAAELTVDFASTSGDQTRRITVLHTTVQGQSSRTYDLNGLRGDERVQNSFIVHSSAPSGDVLSKLVARSDGILRELELLGKDEHQIENAGNHPWSIEDGTLSTLVLFNHSSHPQYFNVRVAEDRAVWLKAYKLNSMETKAISINDLITLQEKDEKGHVLPKNLVKGEVGWLSPATTEVSGRILESDRLQPLARNFSCNNCDFLCNTPTLNPYSSLNFGEGQQGQLGTITSKWCSVSCGYYGSCPQSNYTITHTDSGLSYSWSGGGSVASIVSGGLSSSSTWQGNAPGQTTAYFSVTMGSSSGYSCQSNAPINVCPQSITVVTVSNASLAANYPPYRTGIGGFAQMSVGPSNSTTYNRVKITENITQDSATNCPATLLSQPAFKNVCSGNSTFTVGAPLTNPYGVNTAQTNNAFWDVHTSTDGADDMGAAGYTTTCNIVCDQTYSCDGKPIGSFKITRTISHTTVGSNPAVSATNVSVSKK